MTRKGLIRRKTNQSTNQKRSLGLGSYASVDVQSAYSTAPADRAAYV